MAKFYVLLFLLTSVNSFSQTTKFKTKKFSSSILNNAIYNEEDYNVSIINIEAPDVNGENYKSFLLNKKIISKGLFPYKTIKNRNKLESIIAKPEILNSFGMMHYNSADDTVPIYGGLPNDNSMAISNDGLLLLAINSSVQIYDTKNDSLLFPNEFLSLRNVFSLSNGNYFDPKVIYDKDFDRFILVFLKNNNPSSNLIIVGFSKTNNPIDGWNVYTLPGNPLNNNRWTDFPSIALSDSSLYFTGNLIVPNVSWQIGFDGSILWEIKKSLGYNEALDINPKLYYDIKYNNNYVRNLHCVQGANGNVSQFNMLSNKNFDIQNDTFFVISLKDNLDSSFLEVKELISDLEYGVPPNGRQADTDTTDATEGLQTNDARVLGAIQFDDEIQFVSNSIKFETGFSAIYHGRILNLNENPILNANIISDDVKDYGYPNIAWSGNEDCDRETIIAFNHTSFVDFPGISAVYCNNEGVYSDKTILKEGEQVVDRLGSGYERWGDYFGMQKVYNEKGKVYTFGFTTDISKKNYGWVNVLKSPNSDTLYYEYSIISDADYCTKRIKIDAYGGIPPYSINWKNNINNETLLSDYFCNGDSVFFTLNDSRGCNLSDEILIEINNINKPFSLFPNPTNDILAFQFMAIETTELKVEIFDLKGSLVKLIANQEVKKGLNEIYFSTKPLPKGVYYLKITDKSQRELTKEKFIKK